MFYSKSFSNALRFGDIIKGFISIAPKIDDASVKGVQNYSIGFIQNSHHVILTPCCSLKDNVFSLAPLVKIQPKIFSNEYFEVDLTRINRIVPPDKQVPSAAWKSLTPEVKDERNSAGPSYTLLSQFIFSSNRHFEKYTVSKKIPHLKTKYYKIDFRHVIRVECKDNIQNLTYLDKLKICELSVNTRRDLRDKMAYFYGREPEEDKGL